MMTPWNVPVPVTIVLSLVSFFAFRELLRPYLRVDNLDLVAASHLMLGVVTFLWTQFATTAPYGRHVQGTNVWLSVDARWAWITQEAPTLLCAVPVAVAYAMELALAPAFSTSDVARVIPLLLYIVHYSHRTLYFPFQIRPSAPVPQHVTSLATLYCTFNGLLQSTAFLAAAGTPDLPLLTGGVALFVLGMLTNMWADYTLIGLRAKKAATSGGAATSDPKARYSIPRGGLFELISCPNFAGEFVEWIGYATCMAGASGGFSSPSALAALSFALYTAANTFPRAYSHHKWYLRTFGDEYKKLRRRAVIPYVW